jgi:hypothetical protein
MKILVTKFLSHSIVISFVISIVISISSCGNPGALDENVSGMVTKRSNSLDIQRKKDEESERKTIGAYFPVFVKSYVGHLADIFVSSYDYEFSELDYAMSEQRVVSLYQNYVESKYSNLLQGVLLDLEYLTEKSIEGDISEEDHLTIKTVLRDIYIANSECLVSMDTICTYITE